VSEICENLKLFASNWVLSNFLSQIASHSPNSPFICPIYKKIYSKYGITSELDFSWFIWSSFCVKFEFDWDSNSNS
jgi:hypothetical protein